MIFYRVANNETKQGLWYSFEGEFTGLIHSQFDFCKNKDLPMPFNEEIQNHLSVTKNLNELFEWFSKEDIIKLQDFGFFIFAYECEDYLYYNNHCLIHKDDCRIVNKIWL